MLEETATNYFRQKFMSANKQWYNLVQYTWTNSLKTLFKFFCGIHNKEPQCCLFFISTTFFFILKRRLFWENYISSKPGIIFSRLKKDLIKRILCWEVISLRGICPCSWKLNNIWTLLKGSELGFPCFSIDNYSSTDTLHQLLNEFLMLL